MGIIATPEMHAHSTTCYRLMRTFKTYCFEKGVYLPRCTSYSHAGRIVPDDLRCGPYAWCAPVPVSPLATQCHSRIYVDWRAPKMMYCYHPSAAGSWSHVRVSVSGPTHSLCLLPCSTRRSTTCVHTIKAVSILSVAILAPSCHSVTMERASRRLQRGMHPAMTSPWGSSARCQ